MSLSPPVEPHLHLAQRVNVLGMKRFTQPHSNGFQARNGSRCIVANLNVSAHCRASTSAPASLLATRRALLFLTATCSPLHSVPRKTRCVPGSKRSLFPLYVSRLLPFPCSSRVAWRPRPFPSRPNPPSSRARRPRFRFCFAGCSGEWWKMKHVMSQRGCGRDEPPREC